MTSGKVFSLKGKGLKFDTAADLEPHITELRSNDVEEVQLLGNTFGVEASKLLGEVLATKKNLRVRSRRHPRDTILCDAIESPILTTTLPRLLTFPTCSLAAS